MPLPRKHPAYYFLKAVTIEQAQGLGKQFLARHRDLKPCRVNALRIIRYMIENHLSVSLENLDRSYSALKAEGKLKFKESGGASGGSKLLQM